MKKRFCILITFVFVILSCAHAVHAESSEIEGFLQFFYKERSKAMITGDYTKVMNDYLPSEKGSKLALEHEKLRSAYIHAWGARRNLSFIDAESQIRIVSIKRAGHKAKIFLIHSEKLTYQYNGSPTLHKFGIGTRHLLTIEQKKDKWHLVKEWYLDPLEENANLIPVLTPTVPTRDINVYKKSGTSKKYNREKAVSYADKYAGAALLADNKYNKKYQDYTYQGGDCTNFASQVLGDPSEGGGLPMRGRWFYQKGPGVAWIRTDSFYTFLIHSGYGKLIARGTYDQVAKPNQKFPQSALALLKPGDLIAYELDGDVDHFSIVTGRDDQGYPLVNSHTADRYHVPWDLGWDQTTKFYLIRIKD